ncbi:hypothetical protein [Desertivirga xinjiangensis]|uniref:hypothetical protein n=1 Tax=Desertivirga xinjiangensis TaxID=539206 RepID=UPI00210E5C4A|nr:hypothetical protein [Pedobacter xinjiangensis]
MRIFLRPLALSLCAFMVSCVSEELPKQANTPAVKPGLPQPFRFHKAVEVTPGLTFDILSWGRGSEHIGAYIILRSDSTAAEYRSTTGELEGEITDVWNMDMDADGNPEIFIQAKGQDEDTYLNMYIYEFRENGSSQQIRFPDLTSSTKKTYRGKDSVFIKEGDLYREFPTYDSADTAAVKPTGKKTLKYLLRGNSFSVQEIKEEDSGKKDNR